MNYRGRTITSIMLVLMVLAGCSSSGNGSSSTTGTPSTEIVPTATLIGAPTGTSARGVIGAAGGSMGSADGLLTLSIPTGALTSTVTITVQPLTNTAHGGLGSGYRLLPEGQTFSQPVQLTFPYTDADLQGTGPEALSVAYQTSDGYWQLADTIAIDAVNKKVTVDIAHFSDWSLVKTMRIYPATALVETGHAEMFTVEMSFPMRGFEDPTTGIRPYQGYKWRRLGVDVAATILSDWAVNGIGGGNTTIGTIYGNIEQGGYTAPDKKPTPDTVTVSVQVKDLKTNKKSPLTATVTIVDTSSYVGTLQFTMVGTDGTQVSGTADITWTKLKDLGDVRTYIPSGSITTDVTMADCDPVHITRPIAIGTPTDQPGGRLAVYTSTNAAYPMRHDFSVLSTPGPQTFQCGNPRQPMVIPYYYQAAMVGLCIPTNDFPPYTDEAVLSGTHWTCANSVGGYISGSMDATWDFRR